MDGESQSNFELPTELDTDTVEALNGFVLDIYQRIMNEEHESKPESPELNTSDMIEGIMPQDGWSYLALILLIFAISYIAKKKGWSLADVPEIDGWLEWAEDAWTSEWPPVLTVWYVMNKTTDCHEPIDVRIISWFQSEEGWKAYFPLRDQLTEKRQKLIQEAIKAFQEGLYAASAVLFLSQAEGVFYDHTGISRYLKGHLDLALSKFPTGLERWTQAAREVIEGVLGSSAGGQAKMSWNRHQILHGMTTDFGTPDNALRAAMWVEMAWMVGAGITSEHQKDSKEPGSAGQR